MEVNFKYSNHKKKARIAGLWYLVMLITAPIGIMYVPSKIMIAGNATATAANILSHEMLFRVGIFSNLLCQVSFVFLVLALKNLFEGIDKKQSKLMVSLVIAAVPIAIVIEILQLAAIHLLSGSEYLKVFSPDQLNALALSLLNFHEHGIVLAAMFWGLWLLPFGWLVIKSEFIPKILGILLIIGGCSYIVDSSLAILFPNFRHLISSFLLLPLSVGELSMVVWLLVKGVKKIKV